MNRENGWGKGTARASWPDKQMGIKQTGMGTLTHGGGGGGEGGGLYFMLVKENIVQPYISGKDTVDVDRQNYSI